MNVLVLGGGGREHALCASLAASASVERLLCAPGNPGIAEVATCVAVDATDPTEVVRLAREETVDLVVVGPEAPLVAGVGDALVHAGVRVFGPGAAAARLEGSKAFAKDVMASAGVATAGHWSGSDRDAAREALSAFGPPYVVKADGLAAGKGVVVTEELGAAEAAVDAALVAGRFGEAGRTLVVEAFLDGPEVSLFGICDGARAVPLAAAQDYKRLGDGGDGPNTGGMGAYSPVPAVDDALIADLTRNVLQPVVEEMARRGTPYVGALYAGLVLTADGPRVLEFNARFGDPEAQVVLPRVADDLAAWLDAAAAGRLPDGTPRLRDDAAVTVVVASEGYPERPVTGRPISGLDAAASVAGAQVFHAGTARDGDRIVSSGGRVLAVTGVGRDLVDARRVAYEAADEIRLDGRQSRMDIAAVPLTHVPGGRSA